MVGHVPASVSELEGTPTIVANQFSSLPTARDRTEVMLVTAGNIRGRKPASGGLRPRGGERRTVQQGFGMQTGDAHVVLHRDHNGRECGSGGGMSQLSGGGEERSMGTRGDSCVW